MASEDSESFGSFDGKVGLRRNSSWHFTIVSAAFTLGGVFAPYTMSAGGWLWGSLFWAFSVATTWWSGVLIGKCVLDGYKRGIGSTYAEMMGDAFGTPGFVFTVVMQLLTYYMLVVALLVDAANWCLMVQQVLQELSYTGADGLCLWQWILVSGAVLTGFGQIQTWRQIMPFAIASLAFTVLRQGIMYYQMASYDVFAACQPRYGGVTATSAINSLSTTAFLFGGHGLFPEQIREMRKPDSYFSALHVCYVIVIVMYVSNFYVAYYGWGDWLAGDVQFNWPLNEATLVSAVLSILWVLIAMSMANVMMLGLIEQIFDLEPPHSAKPLARALRFMRRTGFVWSEVFFAFMLSSAGIADLQALVGAFGFTALTYYAPFAAYWKLIARREKEPMWLQLSYGIAFLSGIALMIVGMYTSLSSIIETLSTYNLFDTSTCSTSSILDLNSCSNPCREAYGYLNATCSS